MSGFINRGLGDMTDAPDLSFLGGSVFTAAALGLGLIVLFKIFDVSPKRRRSSKSDRGAYVRHVAKKHKLSRADQNWLMEHEE